MRKSGLLIIILIMQLLIFPNVDSTASVGVESEEMQARVNITIPEINFCEKKITVY